MAIVIPLQTTPNQSFTIRLDAARYDIGLRACGSVMAATIARDGVALVSGLRLVAGTPLLPYAHLQVGNFIFLTENDALPWWEDFARQTLVYLSQAEIAAL